MKNYNDKYTSILKNKYHKKISLMEENENIYNRFPSNKQFKDLKALLERKYHDKIWWKLLPNEDKKYLMYLVFKEGYNIYILSEEQINKINSFKEKNPLTNEIREFKLKQII